MAWQCVSDLLSPEEGIPRLTLVQLCFKQHPGFIIASCERSRPTGVGNLARTSLLAIGKGDATSSSHQLRNIRLVLGAWRMKFHVATITVTATLPRCSRVLNANAIKDMIQDYFPSCSQTEITFSHLSPFLFASGTFQGSYSKKSARCLHLSAAQLELMSQSTSYLTLTRAKDCKRITPRFEQGASEHCILFS